MQKILCLALLALCLAFPAAAEDCGCKDPKTKTIDLAELLPGETTTRTIEPGCYQFELIHGLVNKGCSADVVVGPVFEQPLVNPFPVQEGGGDAATRSAAPCPDLVKAELEKATTNVEVRTLIKTLKTNPPAACGNAAEVEKQARALTSHKVTGCYGIEKREQAEVTITCQGSTDERVAVFTTGTGGQWRTIYGFTFVPNEDEDFFTRAKEGEDGVFEILEKEDRKDFDYIPSVLFHRISNADVGKRWAHGPLAGLGYDAENVTLFGGYGWSYHENVTFTLGLAVHEQTRLNGRFDVGQELQENLDASQLLDETFGANAYFGIAFRFGTDPHAERIRLQKEAAAAQRKAAREAAAREAAEKKQQELAAAQLATCQAKAAEDRVTALAACEPKPPAEDATDAAKSLETRRLELCKEKAEASHQLALATCKSKPLEEAQAREELQRIETAKEELKDACLKSAESTFEVDKGECPDSPEADKKTCEDKAEQKKDAAELKCLADFQTSDSADDSGGS